MSGAVNAKSLIGELQIKRTISPLAGKLAPKEMLVEVVRLEQEYLERRPDVTDPNKLVSFGTSSHRVVRRTFTKFMRRDLGTSPTWTHL
jgi:hypothetical protein